MMTKLLSFKRSTSTTAEDTSSTSVNFHPIRQPKGPEPGKDFTSRTMNEVDQLAAMLTRQHLGIV